MSDNPIANAARNGVSAAVRFFNCRLVRDFESDTNGIFYTCERLLKFDSRYSMAIKRVLL
jgi:hypothetical protein